MRWIICLFKDHVPVKVVQTWKTTTYSQRRHRFSHNRRRKSWIECDRCGKKLE